MTETTDRAAQMADYEKVLNEPDDTVAAFEYRRGPVRRLQEFLHAFPTAIPFIVLILGLTIFSLLVGRRFFAPFNLSLILQQVTIIGTLGVAQTLIILTAGIDLSVGVIMILASIVMGRLAVTSGVSIFIAFPAGLLVGLACGYVNGALVTYLRLPPFIVTLGTWSVFGALILFYSHSATIRQQDIAAAAPLLQWTGNSFKVGGAPITIGSLLMLAIAAVVWYVLNRTPFGRHVYATGDDPNAARLAGISTTRTLLAVYSLAGLICAVAGWIMIGRIGAASPLAGQDANLDSITAVVIGGTSLFGGVGTIFGTVIGTILIGVLLNGLVLMGVSPYVQQIIIGVIIVLAVAFDTFAKSRRRKA